MITAPRLDPSTFPDSPYAAELQRGAPKLHFAPKLEAEYQGIRLRNSRSLIRVVSLVAAFLVILHGTEQAYNSGPGVVFRFYFMLVVAGSIVLAAISWSPGFERLYLPWARVIVPLRNAIMGARIGWAAAHGQPEMLVALPIALFGAFFFLGLSLRAALVCCAVTVSSYLVCATLSGLPRPVAMHADMLLLDGVVACVIAAWSLEKISRRSFLEGRLLADLAQRDALTGTKNRRVFDGHLGQLWRHAVDAKRTIAILLIDIDHFKAYNDYYGHQAGDQTLRRVAQTAQKFIRRPLDVLARYGGEEFAVLLYDVDENQARDVADRIRQAVGELYIEHRASRTSPQVTISVGVAAITPTAERNPRGALQLADQALYAAKVQGRNRVELMDKTHHELLVTGVFAVASAHVSNDETAPTAALPRIRGAS